MNKWCNSWELMLLCSIFADSKVGVRKNFGRKLFDLFSQKIRTSRLARIATNLFETFYRESATPKIGSKYHLSDWYKTFNQNHKKMWDCRSSLELSWWMLNHILTIFFQMISLCFSGGTIYSKGVQPLFAQTFTRSASISKINVPRVLTSHVIKFISAVVNWPIRTPPATSSVTWGEVVPMPTFWFVKSWVKGRLQFPGLQPIVGHLKA